MEDKSIAVIFEVIAFLQVFSCASPRFLQIAQNFPNGVKQFLVFADEIDQQFVFESGGEVCEMVAVLLKQG